MEPTALGCGFLKERGRCAPRIYGTKKETRNWWSTNQTGQEKTLTAPKAVLGEVATKVYKGTTELQEGMTGARKNGRKGGRKTKPKGGGEKSLCNFRAGKDSKGEGSFDRPLGGEGHVSSRGDESAIGSEEEEKSIEVCSARSQSGKTLLKSVTAVRQVRLNASEKKHLNRNQFLALRSVPVIENKQKEEEGLGPVHETGKDRGQPVQAMPDSWLAESPGRGWPH